MSDKEIEKRLIEEKILSMGCGYIEFSNDNAQVCAEENCKGWDMHDRRCQCGNRRVCWRIDNYGKKDEDLTVDDVYAEAY